MTYSAYIFDLDGTLLDTLSDLVRLTNMVLEGKGWPSRSREEILSYVGNGGRSLLGRAAPSGAAEADIDEAFALWQELYPEYGHALTKPYPGIVELLGSLKAQGAKLGVLSNKFDAATKEVIGNHFPSTFDVVRGECAEIPRKPNPQGLLRLIDQLGVSPDQVAYIGDSGSDMTVAVAAGAFPVGVTWGYRSEEELREAGAARIVEKPGDIALL